MLIAISDRNYWRIRVEEAINNIKAARFKENKAFEDSWAAKYNSRPAWLRFLFGPSSPLPPKNLSPLKLGTFYPSIMAWGTLETLQRVLAGLNTQQTGVISINEKELGAIQNWSNNP